MHETLNGNGHTHAIGGWKADLRDYARWEYGTEEAAKWLLHEARRRRPRRAPLVTRIQAWFRSTSVAATPIAVLENRGRQTCGPPSSTRGRHPRGGGPSGRR